MLGDSGEQPRRYLGIAKGVNLGDDQGHQRVDMWDAARDPGHQPCVMVCASVGRSGDIEGHHRTWRTPRDQPCPWCEQVCGDQGTSRAIMGHGGPHKSPRKTSPAPGVCTCGVIERHQVGCAEPHRGPQGTSLVLVVCRCGVIGGHQGPSEDMGIPTKVCSQGTSSALGVCRWYILLWGPHTG